MDVRAEREKRGLTQEQLGKLVGAGLMTVKFWEESKYKPCSKSIKLLEESFHKLDYGWIKIESL